jgi:hypothetical protein
MLREIRYFFEDYWLPLVIGFAAGSIVLLGILFFTDSGFNESDCSEEVLAAEAALVGEMLEAIGPELIQMQLQIQALQAQVEAGSNGSSGDAGIRPNEALGAYSDPAGEFYCFPTEGAGFD